MARDLFERWQRRNVTRRNKRDWEDLESRIRVYWMKVAAYKIQSEDSDRQRAYRKRMSGSEYMEGSRKSEKRNDRALKHNKHDRM